MREYDAGLHGMGLRQTYPGCLPDMVLACENQGSWNRPPPSLDQGWKRQIWIITACRGVP
ncbi:hypothetical protein GXY_15292 [Novacetimonas hansenii ATCC 23769]|uniref:Uncharacterized protein n=1 Tax=Novacetimonas hansenii ATCC 23769 TaxID=714995 RepID=D5QIS7_NOVHA|nr:hypothetical protein GXY_15292 [Novacetimonas hansenii ATCC 23769]